MTERLPRCAVGLDLSLRAPAVAALPADWEPGDWRRVAWAKLQPFEHRGAERLALVSGWVMNAVIEAWVRCSGRDRPARAPAVFVEQHAFFHGGESRAMERAELVGAVKVRVWEKWRDETVPLIASAARKHLFGPQKKMDRKTWKAFIAARFGEMGFNVLDEDVLDALVIANHGRYQLGLPSLAFG